MDFINKATKQIFQKTGFTTFLHSNLQLIDLNNHKREAKTTTLSSVIKNRFFDNG